MGHADIPTEVKPGRNRIFLEVDRDEISQVIDVVQAVLKSLAEPNVLLDQTPPIRPPAQSANAWPPHPSPRGQPEQSLFASPLPQARAVSSSLFSAPFPVSSELSSPAYSGIATSPPQVTVRPSAIAALQHRFGVEAGNELGLTHSAEWDGASAAVNVPLPSASAPGYSALAPSRPAEIRQAKSISPIAPPFQSLAPATSSPQQSTLLQSRPPATSLVVGSAGGPQPQQQQQQPLSRVEFGTPPGISEGLGLRTHPGPVVPSASPKTKAAGLQVSNGHPPATGVSLSKAPGPGQSHLPPGLQGSGLKQQQHEAGQAGGFAGSRAVFRPARPGPAPSPGTSGFGWSPDGDRALIRTEQGRKTRVADVVAEATHRTGAIPNPVANISGKVDKMSIAQRGGNHMLSPGPMNGNNGVFAPNRGPIGQHARMQGAYGQMARAGAGMPDSGRMFPEVEPRFSKGGLVRVPIEASLWRGRWTTAAAEHNRDSVTALNFSHSFGGLSERESHTGWLISSSKNLLNLWECVARKKPGDSPLQVLNNYTSYALVLPCLL